MYWLINLIYKIFQILPLNLSLFIGKVIGVILYYNKKKMKIAFMNVKQVFPYKSNRQILSIVKKSFISLGMSLVETFLVDRMKDRVSMDFKEVVDSKGNILVGIHEGSWELYNATFAKKFNYAILVKPQKDLSLNKFLMELREKNKLKVCTSLKELAGYMKKNFWIGLVVDHGAEEKAPFVDFFGQLVPTPGGAVRLSKKFNKKIFPAFGYREGGRHIVIVDEHIESKNRDEKEVLRELNKVYERFLKLHPEEYLWGYKRFKRKKNLSILILTDGKTGHTKQSLAFLDLFKETSYQIKEEVVEVHYRNKFMQYLAHLFALLCPKSCLGCQGCIEFFLKEKSWQVLKNKFFDIIISTGSSPAPLNYIYARSLGAKSCVILKPNLPLSKFDLAIIPEHDGVKGKKVVNIKGALVRTRDIDKEARAGREFFKLGEEKFLSLFIGNFLNAQEEFLKNLKIFLDKLKFFSLKYNYKLLVTTSRRTHPEVEDILKMKLENFGALKTLVIVREKNWHFVVSAFLTYSELVFVTSDSISMLSESLYSGKTTVCVFLERIKRKRHLNFLYSLKDGFVNFLDYPYEEFTFRKPLRNLKEENRVSLKEAVSRLL